MSQTLLYCLVILQFYTNNHCGIQLRLCLWVLASVYLISWVVLLVCLLFKDLILSLSQLRFHKHNFCVQIYSMLS